MQKWWQEKLVAFTKGRKWRGRGGGYLLGPTEDNRIQLLEIQAYGLVLGARFASQTRRSQTPTLAGLQLASTSSWVSFTAAGWSGRKSPYPFVVRSSMDVLIWKEVQPELKLCSTCDCHADSNCNVCSVTKGISPQGGTCPASAHTVFSQEKRQLSFPCYSEHNTVCWQ